MCMYKSIRKVDTLCQDPEGRTGDKDLPGKSQLGISFLRNIGTDPPREASLDPSLFEGVGTALC